MARGILEKNMRFAAEKINTALGFLHRIPVFNDIPVIFAGGISRQSETLLPMIEKYISWERHRLIFPDFDPVDGALRRAMQIKKRQVAAPDCSPTQVPLV